jgi:hypothetical protein
MAEGPRRTVPISEGCGPQDSCAAEEKKWLRPSHKREPVGLKTCGFLFARYYIY